MNSGPHKWIQDRNHEFRTRRRWSPRRTPAQDPPGSSLARAPPLGNIQWHQSGNIQSHSGNISVAFREHFSRIQGTFQSLLRGHRKRERHLKESQFTTKESEFTLKESQLTQQESEFTLKESEFTLKESQFTFSSIVSERATFETNQPTPISFLSTSLLLHTAKWL
jgi:hypothetical protein